MKVFAAFFLIAVILSSAFWKAKAQTPQGTLVADEANLIAQLANVDALETGYFSCLILDEQAQLSNLQGLKVPRPACLITTDQIIAAKVQATTVAQAVGLDLSNVNDGIQSQLLTMQDQLGILQLQMATQTARINVLCSKFKVC